MGDADLYPKLRHFEIPSNQAEDVADELAKIVRWLKFERSGMKIMGLIYLEDLGYLMLIYYR